MGLEGRSVSILVRELHRTYLVCWTGHLGPLALPCRSHDHDLGGIRAGADYLPPRGPLGSGHRATRVALLLALDLRGPSACFGTRENYGVKVQLRITTALLDDVNERS